MISLRDLLDELSERERLALVRFRRMTTDVAALDPVLAQGLLRYGLVEKTKDDLPYHTYAKLTPRGHALLGVL